jgi:Flp pilus assembly protein CpaB
MAHGEPGPATAVRAARPVLVEPAPERSPHIIRRRRGLPGSRAVVGGLLIALAAIGVFVAYADATRGPSDPVVVARRAIRIGDVLEAADLRVATADLPTGATGSFDDVASLVGRVALGPIAAGELVQSGSVTDDRATSAAHEVALLLPREQVAVGHLKQGERVDVFVTRDARTTSVVRGAQVVQIGSEGDGSLTSEREVSIVVAAPSGEAAAALVHALRTGDVTVVRSTFAAVDDGEPLEVDTAGTSGEGTGKAGSTGE